MIYAFRKTFQTLIYSIVCLVLSAGILLADKNADKILESLGRDSGLFVVIGCGDKSAPGLAAALGANGNALVHAVAGDARELESFNAAIAEAGVKGAVTAEILPLSNLPYRNYMANVVVIMDPAAGEKNGLKMEEVRRVLAPNGRLVTCVRGAVDKIEEIPLPANMDVWSHRYHGADGIPMSDDEVFDLPVGFRWNAGLPMNFDNPKRSANRYSSTRAMAIDDFRCLTFTTAVYENLGDGWNSSYGTNQYMSCRDAFNGRLLWRKEIGDTYYGGLYIENLAPFVTTGTRVYLASPDGRMLAVDTKTGETLRALPTKFIPGVIAASDGIVVAATWKDGKVMGSIEHYDRRRMDWDIDQGSIEAYDDKTGKLLWKNDFLGTSLLIADGCVYVVSRSEKDPVEKNHNKPMEQLKRPPQKVMAMDLKSGKFMWETSDETLKGVGQRMKLESAGHGVVAVSLDNRNKVDYISKETGALLGPEEVKKVQDKFFRYQGHVCTPVMRVNDVILGNRGTTLSKPGMKVNYGGVRGACLTGTIPAYGSGFIAQNWCNCAPAMIPGLISIGPIGREPTVEEMETAAEPVKIGSYSSADVTSDSMWSSFRGNAERSSAAACDISNEAVVLWKKSVADAQRSGTLKRDWLSYLNSRLTAPVISGSLAVAGDMDHNEVIAFNLKDGSVAWRFMTAGRMDVSPTLYKGICLVGDHTGYVSALKVKTGELIYRLRIAPEEKRMLSYGKVESVWPVIGGVLAADGMAYATAGRTQGSDGGIVVRAFIPETGKPIWARAIPQRGNGVTEPKPTRNDALVLNNDLIMLMNHRMNRKTGELIPDPVLLFKNKALADAVKEKGKGLDRNEQNDLWKKLAPEIDKIKGPAMLTSGNEGIYSWNWTRVGHRKFLSLNYDGFSGDTVCWNDNYRAACDKRNSLSFAYVGAADPAVKSGKRAVNVQSNYQVTSMILCNNVLLLGGAVRDTDEGKGFVQAVSLDTSKTVWEHSFDSKLAFNGLAVDNGQIIASFDDGSVACIK